VATLLLSAGDASGDLHAAEFARAFARRNPGARLIGLGGEGMRAAGVELVAHQRDLALGGLLELAGGLRGLLRAWRRVTAALDRERPDLVVLVDSAGFNLPLARRVKRKLGSPVLYYVAPQVWAWRSGRIRKLARRVDRLAVIFPFEPRVYTGTSLPVDFVGHPLLDSIPARSRTEDAAARDAARARCGLAPGAAPVVTLLPGSRRNEIAAHLPVQLEAAQRLRERVPSARFVLAAAPSLGEPALQRLRAACGEAAARGLELSLWEEGARDAISAADVVLAKPGTVTMECALLARPLVVMGRANPLTAWILRRAIRVPWLAMPNLIANEAIVPELLQEDADPGRLAQALFALLEGPAREAQLEGLARVRAALAASGPGEQAVAGEARSGSLEKERAVERACRIAEEMLAGTGQ
jgi:lipid-A-disaccharide synthase